jgi:protein involved in polysaccharide export with SLBB domain
MPKDGSANCKSSCPQSDMGVVVSGIRVLSILLIACHFGCATAELRYAARQTPPELLAPAWQAPCALELTQAARRRPNVVEAGDEIDIAVTTGHDTADATRITAIVDEDGTVAVPKLGRIRIAGTVPRSAENVIVQTCFERKSSEPPFVQVSLRRVRQEQVTVLGGVTRPGVYMLPRDRNDLVSALAAAGGLARNAGDTIVIRRAPLCPGSLRSNGELPNPTLTAGMTVMPPRSAGAAAKREEVAVKMLSSGEASLVTLQDGDLVMVEVRDPPTIQVLGLVAHPGNFELPVGRPYRVRDAIAAANGVTNKVVDTVLVCRQIPNNEKRALIQVSLREAARDQAENIILVPGDIVSVEPTRETMLKDGLKYVKYVVFGATMIAIRASTAGF